MLSRLLFWIQSAVIAWFWVLIADKLLDLDINIHNRYMMAFIIFIFNTHNFPPMAWTTLDGLMLATIGIWLLTHFSKTGNQLGYILLGCAALCKQNFPGFDSRSFHYNGTLPPAILYIGWTYPGIAVRLVDVAK